MVDTTHHIPMPHEGALRSAHRYLYRSSWPGTSAKRARYGAALSSHVTMSSSVLGREPEQTWTNQARGRTGYIEVNRVTTGGNSSTVARIAGGDPRESAGVSTSLQHRTTPPGPHLRQSTSGAGASAAATPTPPAGSGRSGSMARGLSRALFCPPGASAKPERCGAATGTPVTRPGKPVRKEREMCVPSRTAV